MRLRFCGSCLSPHVTRRAFVSVRLRVCEVAFLRGRVSVRMRFYGFVRGAQYRVGFSRHSSWGIFAGCAQYRVGFSRRVATIPPAKVE